jgi:hypothetical protein
LVDCLKWTPTFEFRMVTKKVTKDHLLLNLES